MRVQGRWLPLLAAVLVPLGAGAAEHPWRPTSRETVASRIPPPAGYARVAAGERSFARWLRGLPLLPGRGEVRLFDGRRKANQGAHLHVLDLDVGRRDLQQCADAAIRLRAEYLWASGRADEICFRFTSGHPAPYTRWRAGERPQVRGQQVSWAPAARTDGSYPGFRRYLELVFAYAGTASLGRELEEVGERRQLQAGDVFLEPGFPGHAVVVLDVAEDARGHRAFLLAQGFMPAQQVHILRNPRLPASPWYLAEDSGPLVTPEWTFRPGALRRFPERTCAFGG